MYFHRNSSPDMTSPPLALPSIAHPLRRSLNSPLFHSALMLTMMDGANSNLSLPGVVETVGPFLPIPAPVCSPLEWGGSSRASAWRLVNASSWDEEEEKRVETGAL